jgi:hypothetical protein
MSINWERGNALPGAIKTLSETADRNRLPWDNYHKFNTTNYKSAHSFEMDYDGSNYATPSGSSGMYWENNNEGFQGGISAGVNYTTGNMGLATGTTSNPQIGNVYWRRYLYAWTLTQAEIFGGSISQGIGSIGTLTGLAFYITNPPGASYQPQTTEIGIVNLPASTTDTFNPSANAGLVRCFDASVSLSSASGITNFNFNITNFSYTGGALGITYGLSQCPNNYNSDGQSRRMQFGTLYYARSDAAGAYSYNDPSSQTGANSRPATYLTFG